MNNRRSTSLLLALASEFDLLMAGGGSPASCIALLKHPETSSLRAPTATPTPSSATVSTGRDGNGRPLVGSSSRDSVRAATAGARTVLKQARKPR